MAEPVTANSAIHARLEPLADGFIAAAAVSLPWSTSATAIFVVLWILALIPTLSWIDFRRDLATPAGGLPVLLFALGLLGMLWADVTLLERWKGLDSFFKLLAIPLLLVQFRRSSHAHWVFAGYLFSCIALLIVTAVVMAIPSLALSLLHFDNVLMRNAATQSGEFVTCIFGLLYLAHEAVEKRRWLWVARLRGDYFCDACRYFLCVNRPHGLGCRRCASAAFCNQEAERQRYRACNFSVHFDWRRCLVHIALPAPPGKRHLGGNTKLRDKPTQEHLRVSASSSGRSRLNSFGSRRWSVMALVRFMRCLKRQPPGKPVPQASPLQTRTTRLWR